ncbi:MAG: DUF4198 domain-containing protein [Bacteroidota bacterium]
MKKLALLFTAFVLFCSHDMFLKTQGYFLSPNIAASIHLFNGTFDLSENIITRDRMIDVSLVGNGSRSKVDTSKWTDIENTTVLSFKTGAAGTWVAGVSTRPRNIELTAKKFNDYLHHDGVLDMLKWRRENNALDKDAVEKYSKHVKTIFQVGEKKTNDWQVVLDYPIEFVPLSNPYEAKPGDKLQFKLLRDGAPLPNHLVYVGSRSKGDGHDHQHNHGKEGHSHDHSKEGHQHDHNKEGHSHDHGKEGHQHDHNKEGHSHDHSKEGHQHDHNKEGHSHDHSKEGHSHDHNKEGHSHDHGKEGHSHDHNKEGHSHDHNKEGHNHDQEKEGHQHGGTQLRTNADGIVTMKVSNPGEWYLRTIHMALSEEPGLTHESNWATLTFECAEGHSHDHASAHSHDHGDGHHHHGDGHDHDHSHDDEGNGPPQFLFWMAGIAVLGGVLAYLRQSKS